MVMVFYVFSPVFLSFSLFSYVFLCFFINFLSFSLFYKIFQVILYIGSCSRLRRFLFLNSSGRWIVFWKCSLHVYICILLVYMFIYMVSTSLSTQVLWVVTCSSRLKPPCYAWVNEVNLYDTGLFEINVQFYAWTW